MEKINVKIFDKVNGKFRSTSFKVDEINKDTVVINSIPYSRKNNNKLIGRISVIKISEDRKYMMGHSFPIYA